jgi:hypothetical protein
MRIVLRGLSLSSDPLRYGSDGWRPAALAVGVEAQTVGTTHAARSTLVHNITIDVHSSLGLQCIEPRSYQTIRYDSTELVLLSRIDSCDHSYDAIQLILFIY